MSATVDTREALAPHEERIADMAAEGWDQDPDTGRFDWDDFLYRVERDLGIDLPATMDHPVIRRVQRIARNAAAEARA